MNTNYPTQPPTFESVWAMLQEMAQETRERSAAFQREMLAMKQAQAERDAKYEREKKERDAALEKQAAQVAIERAERDAKYAREWAERNAAYEKQMAEADRRWRNVEKAVKNTTKSIADLNRAFSRSVERITTPDLQKKFKAMGYEFGIPLRNQIIKDNNNRQIAEVDVIMENHEYVMIVEVKNNLQNDDIHDHFERLSLLRKNADSKGDQRRYLGALAAPDVDNRTIKDACKAGFFVVRMSDNAVDIITTEDFKPREW